MKRGSEEQSVSAIEKAPEAVVGAASGTGRSPATFWAIAAFLLSGASAVGSLYLSMGMGLRACPLCFYQRTFAMGAFAVLALGLLAAPRRPGLLCLLALPLVTGGLGVAGFHEFKVVTGAMECPLGLLDLGTAPAQSLMAFTLLTLVTAMGVAAGRNDFSCSAVLAGWAGIILGAVLAWGCLRSSPPPATPPPGEEHLTCRVLK